ncbi:hypothetical protein DL770_010168 [Monosporascus sp. CRB-9-2]|nr:hypothetical protein DL770_010168 [Monosporascus sp. CRB-9-2]
MESILTRFRRFAPKSHSMLATMEIDIVSRLPYELREMIFTKLEPDEIITLFNVSRRWRDNWLNDEVWPSLAQRWLPGLADHIRTSAGDEEDRGEMFRQALHKIRRRMSGKFASALPHSMCLETERFFKLDRSLPHSEGGIHQYGDLQCSGMVSTALYPHFMMYRSGRIAWWPEAYALPFFAIVDDLRTRTRRGYLFPDNQGTRQGYKTAMSSDLFIMGRGTTVHAWHLKLNCRRSVDLPEDFERCIAEGERVLFISQNAEIYYWMFGGALGHIDANHLGCYSTGRVVMGGLEDFSYRFSSHNIGLRLRENGMLIDFIIHPALNHVFFVVTLPSNPGRQLTVHEINNNVLVESYSLEHHAISAPNIGDLGYLRWEKIDRYGGYCLAHAWLDDMDHPSHNMSQANTPLAGCSHECRMRGLLSVCFNIYTKRFTMLHHPIAKNTPSVHHLWNGHVITNNSNSEREASAKGKGLILSVNSCINQRGKEMELQTVPLYAARPGIDTVLQRRYRVDLEAQELGESNNVDHAFNPHQRLGTNRNWASEFGSVKRLVGDDEFLLFVDGADYFAWSFCDDIPGLPLDDSGNKWWKRNNDK